MKPFTSLIMVVLAAAFLTSHSSGQETTYAPLQIFTNGPGRISPLQAGQMLVVGQNYSLAAMPDAGFAFHNWEWVDVFIETTRSTNGPGEVVTNVQTTVTSKHRFFTRPDLIFTAQPVFVQVLSDQLTTTSAYGWRANFGPAREPFQPGIYQTLTGADVLERGDRVTNGSRVVPMSATFTLDFGATPPSLTAAIPAAVLEGGAPFPNTVRSYYGQSLGDGTYQFTGDYLQDSQPSGTQYFFDWRFSPSTNGGLVWNGTTGWVGGHFWQIAITNLNLVPLARLSIARTEAASVQMSWATNCADYVLEYATNLPAAAWNTVTNLAASNGNRVAVTVEANPLPRFYRLHQP